MPLQRALEKLASDFVRDVLKAIRAASLDEVGRGTAKRGGGPPLAKLAKGRLPRRTPEDIARTLDRIVDLLRTAPKGLRAEEIQAKLGLDKRELPRPIQEGLASRRLAKKGAKRATTYFVGSKKK